MPRWYAAFRCVGNAPAVLAQISTKIQLDDLGRFVPRICFEKRPGREFYLCMAIESPIPGEPPEELQGLLSLRFLNSPVRADSGLRQFQPFRREEVRNFVGAEANVQDYARRIHYHSLLSPPIEDPFGSLAWLSRHNDDRERDIVEQTHRFDRLLLWLSTTGSGSFASFQHACIGLNLIHDGAEIRRILRRLRLLGHIECSRDGSRWSIAPPVLSRLSHATEAPWVLCGGRDVALLTALRREAEIVELPQGYGEAPATVYIHAADPSQIERTARAVSAVSFRVVDSAAEQLAKLLPPLVEWQETLQELQGILPSMVEVKRYNGFDFVDEAFEHASGLYELWPISDTSQPARAPKYTLFYDAATDRWLRGDWYGLRYLALSLDGEPCEVRYDEASGCLAVPEERRWPELYERALVLASGRLPMHRGGWLIYEAISQDLLDVLAPKLHLQPWEVPVHA